MQKREKIILKSEKQIHGIRRSCRLVKEILDALEERIQPGITTGEIDAWVYDHTVLRGARPAPLNYHGYPASTCTSINDVICHGIPDNTVLQEGDILNVDVTCILNGFFGDSSRMYVVGKVSPEARRLVDVAKECLYRGIEQVKPRNRLGDIGWAIQCHAESQGYSVVRGFAGHGTGLEFHEAPVVLHFGEKGKGVMLVPGMVFTIEPMINEGGMESTTLEDGWTAVTTDGSLSAQWEHTVAVTRSGVEVLTA